MEEEVYTLQNCPKSRRIISGVIEKAITRAGLILRRLKTYNMEEYQIEKVTVRMW